MLPRVLAKGEYHFSTAVILSAAESAQGALSAESKDSYPSFDLTEPR